MSLPDVCIQQHASEFEALLDIYRERKPRRVLEVGSYEGGTLFHWLQGCPEVVPELVVAVDAFNLTDRRRLVPVWESWAKAETRLEVIAGRSQDRGTLEAVEDLGPFDWVFIDADHAYDSVRADWEAYRPFCSDVMAFHDILPASPDFPEIQVSRLWSEIQAEGYLTRELIEDMGAAWGGIGVVFLSDERQA